MSEAFRVAGRGLVDHAARLRFSFDGVAMYGLAGDTLASALLANGVRLVGRSFKYHRPRGIVCAGSEEPNALVAIDRGPGRCTPNVRATSQELYDGLVAHSQNRWPTLDFDIASLADWAPSLIPAGFYYKTFMWPRWAWRRLYEPAIRASAGLGKAPREPDPDRYGARYAHCDVLIIGGGPAGLAAALEAACGGARVILCDEAPTLGGAIHQCQSGDEGDEGQTWLHRAREELCARGDIRVLTRTTAFGVFGRSAVGLCQRKADHLTPDAAAGVRELIWNVCAQRVVVASGAHERPLVFADNDRPGIMLAGAAQAYLNLYGVLVGRRPVFLVAHDAAYDAAFDLADAGALVGAIVDLRQSAGAAAIEGAHARGIEIVFGATVRRVQGAKVVRRVEILDGRGRARAFVCDALCMSAGWTPTLHLYSQARGALAWDETAAAFLPDGELDWMRCAGACSGTTSLHDAIQSGAQAGRWARGRVRDEATPRATATTVRGWIGEASVAKVVGARAFVDFQNDVTTKDIALAVREGFTSVEHIKRYTTTGMATDQGKTSNVNAMAIAASAMGTSVAAVGHTTFRAPYVPISFGAFAGRSRDGLLDPVRKTPLDGWAQEHGAVFENVALWRRARYFPKAGEDMRAAVNRECLSTRNGVGMFDASTLGKIEVVGPDAAEFLNRMYTSAWSKLGIGRCRYGLMLKEDGFVLDDGVIGRLEADRFHVTTTTGGAPRVLALMEDYLQTEFSELKVWLTSTTEQWAVIALNGPNARALLSPLVSGVDLSPEAFAHMSVREAHVAGAPARLFRVSFTGELGYEINVPSSSARMVWDALYEAGRSHGLCVYGTEAMHVLRAEKGYVIIGQETDGTVTPDDLGLSWTIGKAKADFVGKRSLARPAMTAPNRKQMVGLATLDATRVLEEGAQILLEPKARGLGSSIGHVTSAYFSATLGRSIALGMVEAGRERMGQTIYVTTERGVAPALVTSSVFFDPTGERLNA